MKGFAQAITSLIDAAVEEDYDSSKDWREHLGHSGIEDACERKQFFTNNWYSIAQKPGRMLRLLDRGHGEEDRFVRWLVKAGVHVFTGTADGEQYRFADPDIPGYGGSLDAYVRLGDLNTAFKTHDIWLPSAVVDVCEQHLDSYVGIDFKTANKQRFGQLEKEGVELATPNYFGQAQAYMQASRLAGSPVPVLQFFLVLAVRKDDDALFAEAIPYDQTYASELRRKALRIINASASSDLERVSESPAWYRCKPGFCDHSEVCHFGGTPAVNCRTCAYAKRSGLDWACVRFNNNLTRDMALVGCDSWEQRNR